jgi:hypothetical protein
VAILVAKLGTSTLVDERGELRGEVLEARVPNLL